MIDLKTAQAQMERMIGLEFGPRGREQRQEVLSRMCQARTVLILQSAVTAWLDSNPKFPRPAEIAAIITNLNIAHDEAIQTQQRRREWKEAETYARSPRGQAEANRDMIELRALFVQRLETVDARHAEQPQKRRDWVKSRIRKMIEHIDRGANMQALVDEAYHGEF